jgi:hypothetical protein
MDDSTSLKMRDHARRSSIRPRTHCAWALRGADRSRWKSRTQHSAPAVGVGGADMRPGRDRCDDRVRRQVAVPEGGVTTLPGTCFAHVAAIGNAPVRALQRAESRSARFPSASDSRRPRGMAWCLDNGSATRPDPAHPVHRHDVAAHELPIGPRSTIVAIARRGALRAIPTRCARAPSPAWMPTRS